MIEPAFLAQLRSQHNPQHLLLLVQLEQLAPRWWPNQNEMADELGVQRASLFRGLHWLRRHGLIRTSGSNHGTYLWWAQRSETDRPDEAMAPAWILRDRQRRSARIMLGTEQQWCRDRKISYKSFQNLMCGRIKLLNRRWELVGHPWEEPDDGNLTETQ